MLQDRYIYAYISGASFIFACIFLYLGIGSKEQGTFSNMLIGAIICFFLTFFSILLLISSNKKKKQEKITKI